MSEGLLSKSNIVKGAMTLASLYTYKRISQIIAKSNKKKSSKIENEEKKTWDTVTVGLCQIMVGMDKKANLDAAREAVQKAARQGAQLVLLPECFNCPYSNTHFREYAEAIPEVNNKSNDHNDNDGNDGYNDNNHINDDNEGEQAISVEKYPTCSAISMWAKTFGVYLVAGSIPELCKDDENDAGKIYNTCIVADPNGVLIAKHRKMHLFDIDIPGQITFQESKTLTAGDHLTTFSTPFGKVGVGICYDIRFPELAMLYNQQGCSLLCYPGAFNMTTGPAHWELLQRARAIDNQLYVLTCAPARDLDFSYHSWGHSSVVSPWGEVIATTSHEPDIVMCSLDMKEVEGIRQKLPCRVQKRADLYQLSTLN